MIYRDANIPYWRLSGFYFFYFAFLGGWAPFWNLYLEQELHFTAAQIGLLSSLVLGTKVIGPYLWGWLADHLGKRMQIIRMGSLLAFVLFFGVFWCRDFLWLSIIVVVFSFFWNAVLSQFEVVTLSHLKEQSHRYSQIRLWGSIGFILAVFGLGLLFDFFSLSYLPYFFAVSLGLIWLFSLLVHEEDNILENETAESEKNTPSTVVLSSFAQFMQQLKKPGMAVFFFACFMVQFSHGPYYTFYSIYLEQLGFERVTIGALWSLGVIAELILFLFMPKLFARYSLYQLLIVTLAITAMRWLLIAVFAQYFWVLILTQLMHAASFGSFHAIGVEMVRRYFRYGSIGQGQAFYSAISFGAGGAVGALMSGALWSQGASFIFALAGISVVMTLLVVVFVHHKNIQKANIL